MFTLCANRPATVDVFFCFITDRITQFGIIKVNFEYSLEEAVKMKIEDSLGEVTEMNCEDSSPMQRTDEQRD